MYGNTNAPGAVATQIVPGLMSSTDKARLDSVSFPVIVSGNSVNFTSAAAGRPLRVTVNIEPVQAAGTPSPSNPLPITGWTGVNAARSGKNLFRMRSSNWIGGGITVTVNGDGSLNISGTNESGNPYSIPLADTSDAAMMSGLASFIARGGWMTLSSTTGVYDSTTLNVAIAYQLPTGGNPKYLVLGSSANIPEGSTFLYATLYITPGTTVQTLNGFALQLEQGGEASAFQPYSADTASFTFPSSVGTVYGGTLDVARGLLTVTHNIVTLNGSQAIIKSSSKANTFLIDVSDAVNVTNENQSIESSVSSEIAPSTTWTSIGSVTPGCAPKYGQGVAFCDAGKTSTQDWTDYFTAHPTKFIYRLSAPVTYQLTPQQITTLVGANNVVADCGPVTVTHWPGTGTPVEPVEDRDITTLSLLIKRIEDLEAAVIEGGS